MTNPSGPVDPGRMSIEVAAKLLSSAYRQRIAEEKIRQDVANGAPTNADGTISVVAYTAWLLHQTLRDES
ncbi:hypothetical protein [Novipirellula artificiosorum]|uniref:Uncharacterized protein n=1 Tax=Novipirellula artificiosorum TaxID=2528016 RepID=A0A5C6DTW3_9BACT|nr:hypothetical protein [Novipirellula artificiosorum]TWU39337.1 hypothetical protein Poly41_21610 [Novipirellula artificiosorum]